MNCIIYSEKYVRLRNILIDNLEYSFAILYKICQWKMADTLKQNAFQVRKKYRAQLYFCNIIINHLYTIKKNINIHFYF